MDSSKLRKTATTIFKLNGLFLNGEASNYLIQVLSDVEGSQVFWVETILDRILSHTLNSSLITKPFLEQVVEECGRGGIMSLKDVLHFIDAFDVPKLQYDPDRKKFLPDTSPRCLLATAGEKSMIYRTRYYLLHQRTLHHSSFTQKHLGIQSIDETKQYDLKSVEYLIGSSSKIGDVILLGMIAQLKEGKFYLEDPTGFVEMDLSETTFQEGYYTENCFILAQGHYEDSIFHVMAVGPPIPESSDVSRSYFGMTNFFGGPSTHVKAEQLESFELKNKDFFFAIISDLHLDNLSSLKKLRVLFEGFSGAPGGVFILMGNFLSEPTGTQKPVALRDAFKNLADIIVDFPRILENFKFVLIPGPLDPGFVNILPRPAFAQVITSYFTEKVPNSVFASNPCRIKYCTKEIMILREDVMGKLSRNSLYQPKIGSKAENFVKTMVAQSHLCPLPLHICPVYWSYDHALSIYPLPSVVVIADKGDAFTTRMYDCYFLNPGSFVKSDFRFKTYIPSEERVEDCQLPADAQ